MATYNGQQGFWAKRTQDSAPVFISIAPGDNLQQAMDTWRSRNNTQWVGEDPNNFKFDMATGNVQQFSPQGPDVVGDTYFDTMMKLAEKNFTAGRTQAQQSYDTLVDYIKQDRQLFNEDQARSYGKALQQVNESAYAHGVGESGIKTGNISDTTAQRDYQTKKQDIYEKQKQNIASQDLQNKLDEINRSEAQTRESLSRSPYATYQY